MDQGKLITVVIWATLAVIFYELLKTRFPGSVANPLGVPITTGNAALDQQLLGMSAGDAAASAAARQALSNSDPFSTALDTETIGGSFTTGNF